MSPSNCDADGQGEAPEPSEIAAYRKQGSQWVWGKGVPELKPMKNVATGLCFFRYGSASVGDMSAIRLREEDVEAWLNTPVPVKNGENPCDGYKILQVVERISESQDGEIAMKCETFLAIAKAFHLPPVELDTLSWPQGAGGMFTQDDGSFGYTFIDEEFFVTVDSYDTLCEQYSACPHPLLIPVLMIELLLELEASSMEIIRRRLRHIEYQTGFSSVVFAAGEQKFEDYQFLVKKLGENHSYYLTSQTGLKIVQLEARRQLEHLALINTVLPEAKRAILKKPALRLRERLEYLLSGAEQAILHGNMLNRLQAQQAVLFNLIAQQDTKINIALAKDSKELAAASKQDSSAMKIIAFLTTLFLPGTFVATFFAMPLFDWEAPTIKQATTQHFWFYWAITGPLTLATMITVLSWAIWQRSQARSRALKARKSVGGKEGGSDDSDESEKGSAREEGMSSNDIPTEEEILKSGRERLVDLVRKRRGKSRGFLAREMELRGVGV